MVAIRVMKATSQVFQATSGCCPVAGIAQGRVGQRNTDDHRHRTGHDGRQDLIQRRFADAHDQKADQDLEHGSQEDADLHDAHAVRRSRTASGH